MTDAELMERAETIRTAAHAPYSHYHVGAAIEDEHGRFHLGCNVENAAYPQGSCAESNAIGAMVACGGRRIRRIAVAGGLDALQSCTPCGGCRQRIREFADPETLILVRGEDGAPMRYRMNDLLPLSFDATDLGIVIP